jgi:signal transduction histidine kinase
MSGAGTTPPPTILEMADLLRQLELERAARARAEEALRLRDELIAMVSHELRNPLSAVVTSASILLRLPTPQGDVRWKSCLENISRACDRMRRLISDLLDASDIEASNFTVEPANCDTAPLIAEIVQMHHAVAAAKGVELMAAASGPSVALHCDRERILQVLENLVLNAIKFTESGRVVVAARHDGSAVRFSVIDDGPGIRADERERVFEKHWQGTSARRTGIGLGLAIARGIVTAHGGRIWVDSELGRGSSFHFTVPC